jgi:hypothetical protein
MIITKDYAKNAIEEVIPLVEKTSGLKCNLNNYKINLVKTLPKSFLMGYSHKDKSFLLGKNFDDGDQDWFKVNLGHEIMHNAQYFTYPELIDIYPKMEKSLTKLGLLKKTLIKKLMEGDATLIEKELNKKYFTNAKLDNKSFTKKELETLKNTKITLYDIALNRIKDSEFKRYCEWGELLYKKFNGNREEINKLYNCSLDKLIDIFGTTLINKW